MTHTRQIDRALLLFAATTAGTALVTVATAWLGAEFELLEWLPAAWRVVVGLFLWVGLPLLHFRLQVDVDAPGLLSVVSGVASWLAAMVFTIYWLAVS